MERPEGVPGDATERRTEGPTPAGGAYAIAYFRDQAGNPCPQAESQAMEIVEFDADGRAIWRTYMTRPKPDPELAAILAALDNPDP